MPSLTTRIFDSPPLIFIASFILRAALLLYGIYQDANSPIKYTDIDYYVFTDAARSVSRHASPYDRATYRYTPLLAWILLPTTFSNGDKSSLWFHSGKALFAISDIVAGYFIYDMLQRPSQYQRAMSRSVALKFASVWLLNPMVANISTRGSSEGLLCALVIATLWAFQTNRLSIAATLLGLSVHFKIYPFIYGISYFIALRTPEFIKSKDPWTHVTDLFNERRVKFVFIALATFIELNVLMYICYGYEFLQHTYLHHLTRIDHRHNFSPYNTLLYYSSAAAADTNTTSTPVPRGTSGFSFRPESLAFIPQLLLSTVLIPLSPATTTHLPTTLLAQTLSFVTFNKVCTSQYFLWYLIFLPLYLPRSSLLSRKGFIALAAWVAGQAVWLYFGFRLEFVGESTFVYGLWGAGLGFFVVNCWILGVVVEDGGNPELGLNTTDRDKKKQ